jgi:hypothetical protein
MTTTHHAAGAPRTARRRCALALGAALASGLLAACQATRVGDAESFEEAVRTYTVSDDKKALALAADEGGQRVWGAQYGSLDQDRANEDAMEECQRNARRSGVAAQCYFFAVGDREPRATLEGCRSRSINPRRCAAQAKYGPLLLP